MNFKSLLKKGFVLGLAATLVACTSGKTTTTNTATAAPEKGAEELVLGAIGPYEGNLSVYGLAVRNGITLAIDEFNASGKTVLGKKVKLIAYDSKGDATEATNAYNKLVDNDKAVAILGGVVSGESTAVGTASQALGTPILSASATALAFTQTGPNVFRGCFTDPFQAKMMGEFAFDTLGAKTAAVLFNTSDDYSVGLKENFDKAFTAKGGKVLAAEGYVTNDKDFNTQLTKIKGLNVDVLFIPNYYEDDALIVKQARAMGITATFLGGDGWDGVLNVTDDATSLEGAIYCNHYSVDDPNIVAWAETYKKTFNMEPNSFAYLGYDCANLMLEAIEKAGSTDSKAIVDAMKAIEFKGILGSMKFDENGDPIKDLAYITFKDGKLVTFTK